MLSFARNLLTPSTSISTQSARHVLWIDGVGCFWLFAGERVSIGGPEPAVPSKSAPPEKADIALLSNLKRRHATIVRTGEGYLLEAHSAARVAGRDVSDRTGLAGECEVELARTVRLRFRQSSALSLSARVDFVSDHRPAHAVDGIVLWADTCLLGPASDNHIVCPDWPESVVLVRQAGELWCRSRAALLVNQKPAGKGVRLRSGDVVASDDLRFRIETAVTTG